MTTPDMTARDERIARACAALTDAHAAVADAAGHWYDAGCPAATTPRGDVSPAAIDLRDAVLAWRAAGEEAIRAMRSGDGR